MKRSVLIGVFVGLVLVLSSFVSAGIGIVSHQESLLLNENQEGCLVVGAYNPFSTETYVLVGVSETLQNVLSEQSTETKLLPAGTSSDEAIGLEFCFEVPEVYERDCSVGNFICELSCPADLVTYEGEVSLQSVAAPTSITGTGGSATKMSVSHPMRVRINCQSHPRNYTLAYVVLALVCLIVLGSILFNKYRKPKALRDKEKLVKLKAAIAKETKSKPKKKVTKKKKK